MGNVADFVKSKDVISERCHLQNYMISLAPVAAED